jgi:hypothetical protein
MALAIDCDLARFKAEFEKWQTALGLSDWDCRFKTEDLDGENARCEYRTASRKALLLLDANHEPFAEPEDCAKHEALELLLADIGVLLAAFYSEDLVSNETHKVINRLMAALK